MREEYYRRIVAPVGMSANKWEELRRWCREEAKRRKVNVIKLYSEHDVVTPREYESLTDSEKEKHRAAWRDEARRKANRAKAKASGDMAAELRTYLTNRDVMERAAAKIDKLQEHIAQQQLDIITLGQEVGRLREALEKIADDGNATGCNPQIMCNTARAALGEEKKG
jgi:hypothetical protein